MKKTAAEAGKERNKVGFTIGNEPAKSIEKPSPADKRVCASKETHALLQLMSSASKTKETLTEVMKTAVENEYARRYSNSFFRRLTFIFKLFK